jgi:Uma2 family endonuclease
MARAADKLWTLEEFLAFDDGTDTSYQLFEGRIVAMNPPLRGHGGLVVRLAASISSQLRPPCQAYAEAGIVPVNRRHSWYKADLIVTCTPGSYKDPFIAEPLLVVEVLSPTTSAIDFNRKLPDYQQIPSMRDVLLVSSMERLIRHWRREPDGSAEHRHRRAATVRLSGLPVTIALRELYAGHHRPARAV